MTESVYERIRDGAAWVWYFCGYCWRQFHRQRGLQTAAALAYATLLSLVPLITVMFSFTGSLHMFQGMGESIQQFMFDNFVPAFGNTVQDYLQGFSRNASRLTITGITVLIVIAVMLVATIDNALNRIWHVRNRRPPVTRFLVYWAMITLGPLLVGVGMVSTSYLMALPGISDVESTFNIQQRLLSILPFLTTSVAFTLIYILVPNCFVLRRHAAVGGVLAAVLFELAKNGFGIYVRSVPTEAIYGAIAVVPLFLIWIYTSWAIVLLGAYVTYCLSEFDLEQERGGTREREWAFEDAFRLVRALWQAQKQGHALAVHSLPASGIRLPQHQINEIMEHLLRARWVERTASGEWLLARDMDEVTLLDLHRNIPRRLPVEGIRGRSDRWTQALNSVMEGHRGSLEKTLNVPIAELLESAAEQ